VRLANSIDELMDFLKTKVCKARVPVAVKLSVPIARVTSVHINSQLEPRTGADVVFIQSFTPRHFLPSSIPFPEG
jgi:hypothetical protein